MDRTLLVEERRPGALTFRCNKHGCLNRLRSTKADSQSHSRLSAQGVSVETDFPSSQLELGYFSWYEEPRGSLSWAALGCARGMRISPGNQPHRPLLQTHLC